MSDSPTREDLKQGATLWNDYWQGDKSNAIRDQLVRHFYHLVNRAVIRLRRGPGRQFDPDFVESAAAQGLVEAVERYDPTKSKNFRAYAQMVMRRRVIDAVRRHDWSPWQMEERASTLREKQKMTLSQQLGRRPSEEELDQFVYQTGARAKTEAVPKRQSTGVTNRGAGNQASSNSGTDNATGSLSNRDAAIFHLYVCGKFSQKTIAELFGITQVRVSQILHQARAAYIPYEFICRGQREDGSVR